jgi:hypothetical protein
MLVGNETPITDAHDDAKLIPDEIVISKLEITPSIIMPSSMLIRNTRVPVSIPNTLVEFDFTAIIANLSSRITSWATLITSTSTELTNLQNMLVEYPDLATTIQPSIDRDISLIATYQIEFDGYTASLAEVNDFCAIDVSQQNILAALFDWQPNSLEDYEYIIVHSYAVMLEDSAISVLLNDMSSPDWRKRLLGTGIMNKYGRSVYT